MHTQMVAGQPTKCFYSCLLKQMAIGHDTALKYCVAPYLATYKIRMFINHCQVFWVHNFIQRRPRPSSESIFRPVLNRLCTSQNVDQTYVSTSSTACSFELVDGNSRIYKDWPTFGMPRNKEFVGVHWDGCTVVLNAENKVVIWRAL